MSKKKLDLDNMSAPKNSVEADAMMDAADVVVAAVAPAKVAPEPTVKADINKLASDIRQSGGVKLQMVEGTEVVRATNEEHPAINNGGNEVVTLKMDFFGKLKGDK